MKKILAISFLWIMATSAFSCEKQIILTFSNKDGGVSTVFSVQKNIVASLPTWVPGKEKIPLDVNSAYLTAVEALSKNEKALSKELELVNITIHNKKYQDVNIWYYMFVFSNVVEPVLPKDGLKTIYIPTTDIIILMNGDIIFGENHNQKEFMNLIRGRCD